MTTQGEYITPDQVRIGDTVSTVGAFSSRAVVTDIATPSHPLAEQHGARVLWLDYLNGRGSHPFTAWPNGTLYRAPTP